MSIALKGMTWDHPRGYDPLVACSKLWAEKTGVEIDWEKRSLQDFESYPVDELARRYDFIVIDHPHIGQVTSEGCLLPLDSPERRNDLVALAAGTVGPSYDSYALEGRQWAFPIDAATQVQAYRPDRLDVPDTDLAGIIALARRGRVGLPLRPPHSLMLFFTLAAHLGGPCARDRASFVAESTGVEVWSLMRELADQIDPGDFDRDPIAVLERMAEPDSPIDCSPYIYGYVSYAWANFRPARIQFADIPRVGNLQPIGAALGGTGIAVSSHTRHPAEAVDFAYWVASGEVQRGPYARAGGQPGHAAAWEDFNVNAASGDFYNATRATLERSYLRPRHNGYMTFQAAASVRITEALRARENAPSVLVDLERLWNSGAAPG